MGMDILFYFFSFFGVLGSLSVILVKNPVYSVFFLIFTFCLSSCILLLLSIDFLSFIFIVVYVGAIAVLFLFVVMMLNIRLSQISEGIVFYLPLSTMLGIVFVCEMYFSLPVEQEFLSKLFLSLEYLLEDVSGIKLFSDTIYTHYWFLFVVSGLILLISMVGTISLTLHHSLNVRRQEIYKQVGRDIESSVVFFNFKV